MDIDKLNRLLDKLDNNYLKQIILWTVKDLYTWKEDERVTKPVKNYTAMMYEAVNYQINKAMKKQEEE